MTLKYTFETGCSENTEKTILTPMAKRGKATFETKIFFALYYLSKTVFPD
jgi:hypothetical protein